MPLRSLSSPPSPVDSPVRFPNGGRSPSPRVLPPRSPANGAQHLNRPRNPKHAGAGEQRTTYLGSAQLRHPHAVHFTLSDFDHGWQYLATLVLKRRSSPVFRTLVEILLFDSEFGLCFDPHGEREFLAHCGRLVGSIRGTNLWEELYQPRDLTDLFRALVTTERQRGAVRGESFEKNFGAGGGWLDENPFSSSSSSDDEEDRRGGSSRGGRHHHQQQNQSWASRWRSAKQAAAAADPFRRGRFGPDFPEDEVFWKAVQILGRKPMEKKLLQAAEKGALNLIQARKERGNWPTRASYNKVPSR